MPAPAMMIGQVCGLKKAAGVRWTGRRRVARARRSRSRRCAPPIAERPPGRRACRSAPSRCREATTKPMKNLRNSSPVSVADELQGDLPVDAQEEERADERDRGEQGRERSRAVNPRSRKAAMPDERLAGRAAAAARRARRSATPATSGADDGRAAPAPRARLLQAEDDEAHSGGDDGRAEPVDALAAARGRARGDGHDDEGGDRDRHVDPEDGAPGPLTVR